MTPPVDVRTSEVGTGSQMGAGEVGLGDAIREMVRVLDEVHLPNNAQHLEALADRADALERDRDDWRESAMFAANRLDRVRALVVRSEYGGDPRVEDLRAALDGTQ